MKYIGSEIVSELQISNRGVKSNQTIMVKCSSCEAIQSILYKPHRRSMLNNLKRDNLYKYTCKICLARKRCLETKGISWEEKFGKERADQRKRETSKRSIGSGNNMFGKPSPPGSGNGWCGYYKGWFFRSLHELSFMIKVIERFKFKWRTAETKEFQIAYFDYNNTLKNYFPDFILNEKFLIEVKPKNLWSTPKVQAKSAAAIDFCKSKNLKYKLCCSSFLTRKEIDHLYDNKSIQWTPRYEKKYKQKYKNETNH